MSQQQPSIGRVVHYHAYGTPGGEYKSEPKAAIITQVNGDDTCGICVLNPSGIFFNLKTPFSEVPKAGHWNWPPFVPPVKKMENPHA